jgi:hypothetical protein
MTAVVVAGALATKPRNGGEAWVRLSWILGLQRLGVDVTFLEEVDPGPAADEGWFRAVVRETGLTERAALVDPEGWVRQGLSDEQLRDRVRAADLLVNLSGNLRSPALRGLFRRAAYVDLDPGYTQLWHAEALDVGLDGHDVFFTVGLLLGKPECSLPSAGVDWRPLPPPVVLDEWQPVEAECAERFTTVASWRGAYGPATHRGRTFGVKAHEFRRFASVPELAPGDYELALAIDRADSDDRSLLAARGWRLADPVAVAGTPSAFRTYVSTSSAEFSVAQGIYAETACGWFSDRTAKYLAAAKPALVQDTGVGRVLPTGRGLLTFRTLDEAVAGARRIVDDYGAHCRVAREIAVEHLDSDLVLGRFLEDAL